MYIENTTGYYRGTEQCTRRAKFLILVQPPFVIGEPTPKPRALIRKVALHQFGHWMMGSARAFGHRITISGAYGADGLPCEVPQEVYDKAIPIPPELYEAWNNGGGWNSCGSEAPLMRAWALETFKK